jgi:hypothetical protein
VTSNADLAILVGVILAVGYGWTAFRIYRTDDALNLEALTGALLTSMFALPALALLAGGKVDTAAAHAALGRVLVIVGLSLLAFIAAAQLWSLRRTVHARRQLSLPALPGRVILLVLCGIAVVSALVLQVKDSAIIGHAANPLSLRSTATLPWWYFFALGGLTFAQLALWIALASALANQHRAVTRTTVLTGIFALALSATQGRTMVITLVIPTVLLIHHHRRRLTWKALVAVLCVALVYFLAWDVYRNHRAGEHVSLSVSPSRVWQGITDNLDYTDSFMRLVQTRHSLSYGSTYLAAIFKPVPRSVWKSKPLGGSARLTQIIMPGALQTGFSRAASAPVEGYLNFGFFGAVFAAAVLGVACAALSRWRRARPNEPAATLVYGIGVIGVVMLARTDAQIATTFLGYFGLPLAGLYFWAHLRRSQRRRFDPSPVPTRAQRRREAADGGAGTRFRG